MKTEICKKENNLLPTDIAYEEEEKPIKQHENLFQKPLFPSVFQNYSEFCGIPSTSK